MPSEVVRVRWWRSRTDTAIATRPAKSLVITVTEPVTRDTAAGLVAHVGRVATTSPVVIDLTDIPEFDSEGAAAIVGLQEQLGPDRVTIVGFRQATARLVGAEDLAGPATPDIDPGAPTWIVRRLRAIAVVQTVDGVIATTDDLEPALTAALGQDAQIVVVDLRCSRLTRAGLQAIAFASSTAAINGQELLVVNVDGDTGERLRRAGLSGTTYVAPEPLAGS